MTYKTNWLRGILAPMLVSYAALASAVPANISPNGFHTVFIDNGAVFGMGDNSRGQIAPATSWAHFTPYFTGITNAKSVAGNYFRTAVLRNDGTAMIRGIDWATRTNIDKPFPATNISDIALTMRENFYVVNGTLFRWIDGQAPVAVPGGTNVKWIAAGDNHVVVLFNDGTVGGTGTSNFGQLGTGVITNTPTLSVVKVPDLTNIVEIAAGNFTTSLRNSSGEVFVFGKNDRGFLGLGNNAHQSKPVKLPGVTGATRVIASQNVSGYIRADGTVMMAGWHNYIEGALYNVSYTYVPMPIGTVKDIAVMLDYVVVNRGRTGQLEAWGGNGNGKLGDGTNMERHRLTTAFFTPIAPPPPPAPLACGRYGAPGSSGPFHMPVDDATAVRCGFAIYDSMNACIKANPKVAGIGEICKNLIKPADRGQQEKNGSQPAQPATPPKKG